MLIREFAADRGQSDRLAALTKFLLGRARDEAGEKRVGVDTMINLASNLGISLTPTQLQDMSLQEPLQSLISNVDVDRNQVYFRGEPGEGDDASDAIASGKMSVDQAQNTVDSMAKRATGNAMKGLR